MSQETLITKTTDGSKKHLIKKFVTRGNLDWIFQRMDMGITELEPEQLKLLQTVNLLQRQDFTILEATREKPTRIYLKTGKIKKETDDFRNDKETAQGYYMAFDNEPLEFVESMMQCHKKKLMLDGRYNDRVKEYMIHYYIDLVTKVFRRE